MTNRRSELKRAYKQSRRPMGVFQIRNLQSGKVFIGSSPNLDAIWNRLRLQLRMGNHRNAELQADWSAAGESGFAFEILEQLEPLDRPDYTPQNDLAVLEQLWIEKLQPFGERGYNRAPREVR
jgi:hypothetical protein